MLENSLTIQKNCIAANNSGEWDAWPNSSTLRRNQYTCTISAGRLKTVDGQSLVDFRTRILLYNRDLSIWSGQYTGTSFIIRFFNAEQKKLDVYAENYFWYLIQKHITFCIKLTFHLSSAVCQCMNIFKYQE